MSFYCSRCYQCSLTPTPFRCTSKIKGYLQLTPGEPHLKVFSGLGNTLCPCTGKPEMTDSDSPESTLSQWRTVNKYPSSPAPRLGSESWFLVFPTAVELSLPTVLTCLIMNHLLASIPSLSPVHHVQCALGSLSNKLLALESLS